VPLFVTRGLWAEIFARVDKIRAKARNRKKKYHRLLREVRESTGALSDGGIILNSDHEILWFNPAATRLLGLDPTSTSAIASTTCCAIRISQPTSTAPTGEGITIPSPKEEAGWLTCRSFRTVRTSASRSRATSRARCSVERTRRDFVANASHELRSPLDGHQRLPRRARRRRGECLKVARAGRRDAAPSRADDADPARPDRAHAARVAERDAAQSSWTSAAC
jgi:hypothetical protein